MQYQQGHYLQQLEACFFQSSPHLQKLILALFVSMFPIENIYSCTNAFINPSERFFVNSKPFEIASKGSISVYNKCGSMMPCTTASTARCIPVRYLAGSRSWALITSIAFQFHFCIFTLRKPSW